MNKLVGLTVTLLVVLAVSAGSSAASTRAPAKHSTRSAGSINLGLMGPLTGTRADAGAAMVQGAQLALGVINANGGVLGHHVKLVAQDDANDPGDAVSAAEKEIQSDKVKGIIGPTAFTASVVLSLVDKAKIPDLMWGGGSAFDQIADPNFFRVSPSDTEQADAMVVYAYLKGWRRVALAIGNGSADQSLVPGILAAAKKLKMTVTDQVTIAAGSTSFRSEIQNLFAHRPQAILGQFDIASAGVLFGELGQQGLASTPWVASNLWFASEFVTSVGNAAASGPIYIANPTANGPGEAPFLKLLKQKTGASVPSNGSEVMWDAATIWALGVDEAGTWKSPALERGIAAASKSGIRCYQYSTCYKLLKKHKNINFDGAASSVDFDRFHNVYGPFSILRYNSSGVAQTLQTITPQKIQAVLAAH